MKHFFISCLFVLVCFWRPTYAHVLPQHILPRAYLPNVQIRVGQLAEFDCSKSSDPLGHVIVEYRMDFGNNRSDTFSSPVITYPYFDEGSFTTSLVVVTDDGRVSPADMATVTVSPANRLPVLSCEKENITGVAGRSFYVPITVLDLDGDRVSVVVLSDEDSTPEMPRSLVSSSVDFSFTFFTVGPHFISFIPSDDYGSGGMLVVTVMIFDEVSVTTRYYKKRDCIEVDASKCDKKAVLTFTIETSSGFKTVTLPAQPESQRDTPRIYYFFGFRPREYVDYSVTSSLGGSATGYLIPY